MRRKFLLLVIFTVAALAGCNPFYSVEQSMIERGYRWIQRGKFDNAVGAFELSIREYPDSPLAHLGMADALLEAHREESAVSSYSKALELLRERKVNPMNGSQDKAEVIGQLNFSYQNQGLTFPHGLEAYIYVRRGEAHESLSTRHTGSVGEHRSMAIADYGRAIELAPSYRAAQEGTARLLRAGKAESK